MKPFLQPIDLKKITEEETKEMISPITEEEIREIILKVKK